MNVERFEVPGLAQYSYIVSSDGKAAVIDPIRDIDRYTRYADGHSLTITHILETHIHADFAAGSQALALATGAQLALSAHDVGENYRYRMPHHPLKGGDVIEVGKVTLQALHTPGHTPEHLSFTLYDTERNTTHPVALFSGDFLFVGSMGRPDLLGEAAKHSLATELFRSAHERIKGLPDGVELYPGHGAGSLCGAGMSERAESTLGYERVTNSFFRLDEESFVQAILQSVPAMPDYYPRMKALNSDGAPALLLSHGDHALSVVEVDSLSKRRDVMLLDLRGHEAFGAAHIPGSINIGDGSNLSLWAGWLIDPALRLILIGENGDEEQARRSLMRVGLDRIEGHLAKGFATWVDAGLELSHIPQLSTDEVAAVKDDDVVLDVRSATEWQSGHIAGARHIMLGDLSRHLEELPRERTVITVCGSGYRASIAASLLAQRGFSKVSLMDGGMTAWLNRKLAVSIE